LDLEVGIGDDLEVGIGDDLGLKYGMDWTWRNLLNTVSTIDFELGAARRDGVGQVFIHA
jgi:hypothetical protein